MTTTDIRGPEGALYALFTELGIAWSHHEHVPHFTVADSQADRGDMPGAHVKNMFLKEKKGGLWLVTCLEDRRIRIRDLERAIGAKGCSFGKPDLLWETLGVRPGAVSPFAAINDRARAVRVVLDTALLDAPLVNAHPLRNDATTAVAPVDLLTFFRRTGHEPLMIDFAPLEALEAERAASEGAA